MAYLYNKQNLLCYINRLLKKCFGYVNNHFPIARLYTAFIPIYPAGMHCFTF